MSDLLSPHGFRNDGRKVDQPRTLKCCIGRMTFDYTTLNASDSGAAIVERGETKVIAQVIDAVSARHIAVSTGKPSLSCEISWAPFATFERRMRKQNDRISTAYAGTISGIFEPILCLSNNARQKILVQLTVLSMDGGLLAACINATTLALIRAGIPICDLIAASCTAWVNEQCFVDPTGLEISRARADLTLAISHSTQLVSALLCDSKVNTEVLVQLVNEAKVQCNQNLEIMRAAIEDHVEKLALASQTLSDRIQATFAPKAEQQQTQAAQ
eukprot:Blabericola_migrator_1__3092@NODE_18_length_22925_cov_118_464826_g15_i0_p10_GENE_NODE_18_length_22925_cov_118_464826_g15_i0NODE_18_length_22925_cov_118_464826_g15_i0_p10_ORF_typecomplete_len272_score22_40RNase_PH/PF01138_21/1_9e18RNase_PH/PF01138_21/4_9e03RNase_PH_C/PF03725_15/0_00012DUF3956/PF13104_6/16DUF3956/PF13104_6/2_1_NODE_18_length_22925_cov_118_464826_g15_i010631878